MKAKKYAGILLKLITITALTPAPTQAAEDTNPWSYADYDNAPVASDVLLPLVSFLLPGAGQWARSQAGYGAAYTGAAVAGAAYAANARRDMQDSEIKNPELTSKNIAQRKYILGLQTTQAMGGLSLYHTFRSAVWQRQKHGQYAFLSSGDSPADVLLAPFHFEYLTRPSTWIPLSIATAISAYIARNPSEGYHRVGLMASDLAFASGFSYNAGTHEEAMFRGWLMPLAHQAGLSSGMSNLAQSTLFALAHLGSNSIPLPQFLLGLHLGRVTAANQWSLGESIFIHVWWDVIAFTGNYCMQKNNDKAVTNRSLNERNALKTLPLMFPPLHLNF